MITTNQLNDAANTGLNAPAPVVTSSQPLPAGSIIQIIGKNGQYVILNTNGNKMVIRKRTRTEYVFGWIGGWYWWVRGQTCHSIWLSRA